MDNSTLRLGDPRQMTYPATPLMFCMRISANSIGIELVTGTSSGSGCRCNGRRRIAVVSSYRMCANIVPDKSMSSSEAVGSGSWQKIESNDVLVTLSCEIENRVYGWLDGASCGCCG